MSIKKKIAGLVGACGGVALAECLPHSTRVLFYHGVSRKPLLHPVVQANQIDFDAFVKQIEFFAKKYRFLSADEFYQNFTQKKFSGKELLLTFDDGYTNTAEVVAPYLLEKKIPFMVFLSPHLINTNGRIPSYYTFVAAYDPQLTKLELPSIHRTFSLNSEQERFDVAMELLVYVRSLNETDLMIFLKELADNMSDEAKQSAWEKYDSEGLMTWKQAEELAKEEIVEFASHCYGHTILHKGQRDEEVIRQLKLSRDEILQHCGKCDYLSFPNGGRDYVSPFAQEKAKDFYKMAYGVTRTQVHPNDDPYFVSRIGLFGDYNAALAMFSILSMR